MATEKPRFTVILEHEIAQRLDAYWHSKKLKNKNAAINELLRLALDDKDSLSPDEARLLRYYRQSPAIAKRMSLRALQTAVSYSNSHYSYRAPTPELGAETPSATASITGDVVTYAERIDSMAEFVQELDSLTAERLEAAITHRPSADAASGK